MARRIGLNKCGNPGKDDSRTLDHPTEFVWFRNTFADTSVTCVPWAYLLALCPHRKDPRQSCVSVSTAYNSELWLERSFELLSQSSDTCPSIAGSRAVHPAMTSLGESTPTGEGYVWELVSPLVSIFLLSTHRSSVNTGDFRSTQGWKAKASFSYQPSAHEKHSLAIFFFLLLKCPEKQV